MAVKHSQGKGLARKGCWLELVAGAGGLKKKKKIRDFAVDSVLKALTQKRQETARNGKAQKDSERLCVKIQRLARLKNGKITLDAVFEKAGEAGL